MKEYVTNTVYDLRRSKKITQEDLARELGITRQTVIAIEGGNYTPSVLLALKIARYFGKRVDEIFQVKYEK